MWVGRALVAETLAREGLGHALVIPPNTRHAERIFSVFKRLHTRDKYPGSGVGLSICKRIVERHQGRIWVEQGELGGSRFCFTIPDRIVRDGEPEAGPAVDE